MTKAKTSGLPKYQNPPPPPPKQENKTHEETFVEILTAIRQHSPEQQNWIIGEVLKETAFDRHNEKMALYEDLKRAEVNFDEFMKMQSAGERALSEKQK